jgi:hypothetical protein
MSGKKRTKLRTFTADNGVVPYALHLPEASIYTGISQTVLRDFIKRGVLRVCRPFKKKYLVRTADLRKLIDEKLLKTTNLEAVR